MKDYIKNSIRTKEKILADEVFLQKITQAVDLIVNSLNSSGKILFAGNGGSASDCEHLATELVSKFCKDRKGLCALSLASNLSTISAIGNDYGFEKVFAKQIEALGHSNDVFVAISTSGKSKNILEAIKMAKSLNLSVVGFCGAGDSDMDELCDIVLKVPSLQTSIIQESHIMLGHLICKFVEERIFGEQK